jgi:hypothetical protein
VSPSVGLLARVPRWNPLGLRPGDLHALTPFYLVAVTTLRGGGGLLRFNLSPNSVAVHRFVRPHLVTKIV